MHTYLKWCHDSILCKQNTNQWLQFKIGLIIIKLPRYFPELLRSLSVDANSNEPVIMTDREVK